jgi:hypothetical protein
VGAKPERYCVPSYGVMHIIVYIYIIYIFIRRCTRVDRKPTLNRPPRDTVRKRVKRTAVRRPVIYSGRYEYIVYNYYDGCEDAYMTIIKLL